MDDRDNLPCGNPNCRTGFTQHSFRDHLKQRNKHNAGSVGGMCMMASCPCLGFIMKPPESEPAPPSNTTSMYVMGLGSDDLNEITAVAHMLMPYGDNVNNVTVRARLLLEKLAKMTELRIGGKP